MGCAAHDGFAPVVCTMTGVGQVWPKAAVATRHSIAAQTIRARQWDMKISSEWAFLICRDGVSRREGNGIPPARTRLAARAALWYPSLFGNFFRNLCPAD